MSQDELKIKVVLDDAEFKEQFIRLRRELEQEGEYRPGRGEGIGGPPEERIIERETVVEREVRGEVDEDVVNQLVILQQDVELLKGRRDIPQEFGGMTMGDLKNELAEYIQAGRFTVEDPTDVRQQRLVDEAVKRMIGALEMGLSHEGVTEETLIDSIGGPLKGIRGAARTVRDIMHYRGTAGLRGGGITRDTQQMLYQALGAGTEGGEGWIHRMQKAVGVYGFEAAGKKETLTEFQFPGPSGTGLLGGGRMDVASFFDVATLTDPEGQIGMLQGASVAEAAGKFLGMQKAGQLSGYTLALLREIYWRFYPDKRDQEVAHGEIEKWVDEVVIPAKERGVLGTEKLLKPFFIGMEGRETKKNVANYTKWLTEASSAMRKLGEADLLQEPDVFEIPEDISHQARVLNMADELQDAELGQYIVGRMAERDPALDSTMQGFFNKLVGITPTQYREVMANALTDLGETLASSEERFTESEAASMYVQRWAQISAQYQAAQYEDRDVARRMGIYQERGDMPTGFPTDISGRMFGSVMEYGRRQYRQITEERMLEGMIGRGPEEIPLGASAFQRDLIELRDVFMSGAESDPSELSFDESMLAMQRALTGEERADTSGARGLTDSGDAEFDAFMKAVFGEGGAQAGPGMARQLKMITHPFLSGGMTVPIEEATQIWRDDWREQYNFMSAEQRVAAIQAGTPENQRRWLERTQGMYTPETTPEAGPSTLRSRGWRGGLEDRPGQDPIDVGTAGGLAQEIIAEAEYEIRPGTTGIGMSIDPREYMTNLEKIAVQMGLKGDPDRGMGPLEQFLDLEKNREHGRQDVVGRIGNSIARLSQRLGVLSPAGAAKVQAQLEGSPDITSALQAFGTFGEESMSMRLDSSITPERFPEIMQQIATILDPTGEVFKQITKDVYSDLHYSQVIMQNFEKFSSDIEPMTNLAYPWM